MPPREPICRPLFSASAVSGLHADGQNDEIGWQPGAALRNDDQAAAIALFDPRKPVAQMELHALRGQVLHERDRHLRIQRRHDLRQFF